MGKIVNVILSGGFGTRLWPLSRPEHPKQFLKLFEGKSLFQHTILRNDSLVDACMILTNENHYKMALEQIQELQKNFDEKVLEPLPRNTAPAITLAALAVEEDDILFVTPSDHMTANQEIYEQCVKRAIALAKENYLVTFSIKPEYPETGYGYIEFKDEDVLSFREKPDAKTAKAFVESGNFYWNSGMFCFKAGVFLKEIKKYSLEIYQKSLEAYNKGVTVSTMEAIPEESVDYAVFEKSKKIKTVPSNFQWNDLGTFDSLVDYLTNQDEDNCSAIQKIEGVNVQNSHAISTKKVVGIDLDNLILVETHDTILLLPKGASQKVKEVYQRNRD
ncbi:mannose-1-phosphate guanylyltransferase [Arenibacter amylolyticus]|uniref:mannose-1-phosphate guanylyltransferase n=1 Tax=Arenibacter amylolyticus TaxID=1406873 RepID=UPI000A36D68C|nr:sugar phosphate nucleotidyltransferase [Arenibacter amylolyticus]